VKFWLTVCLNKIEKVLRMCPAFYIFVIGEGTALIDI